MRRMIHNAQKNMTYKKFKIAVALLSSIAVGWVSITLSKEGIGFKDEGAWMGYAIAVALTCSQLIFTDAYEELSWTLLVLGFGGYIYSIHTNIVGVYEFRMTGGTLLTNFNLENFLGGIFIDVYPEAALAWALGAGKIGDALGNLVKTWLRPEELLRTNKPATVVKTHIASQLPKKQKPVYVPPSPNNDEENEPDDWEEEEDLVPSYHPQSGPKEDDGFIPLNYPEFVRPTK